MRSRTMRVHRFVKTATLILGVVVYQNSDDAGSQ